MAESNSGEIDDQGGQEPIEIEPLSEAEQREQQNETTEKNVEKDKEYPSEWLGKNVPEYVNRKFHYYHKRMRDGKVYMVLRRNRTERSLGQLTEEREAKLFRFFPTLEATASTHLLATTNPTHVATAPMRRGLLNVPIRRVAVIPKDYVPTIDVVRYYQIMKNNGFPGDFSAFVNDIIINHFVKCNGIVLPVLLKGDMPMQMIAQEPAVQQPPAPTQPQNQPQGRTK